MVLLSSISPLVLPLDPPDRRSPLSHRSSTEAPVKPTTPASMVFIFTPCPTPYWLALPFGFPKLTMTILFLVERPPPSQPPQTPIPVAVDTITKPPPPKPL